MTRLELNEHPLRGFDGAFYDHQKITLECQETLKLFLGDYNRFAFDKVVTDHFVWLYDEDGFSWIYMDHPTYKFVMGKFHDELKSIQETDVRLHPDYPESTNLWQYIWFAKEIEEDPMLGLPFCPGDKMYVPMGCTGNRQFDDYIRDVRLNHPDALFRKITTKSHIWLYRDTDSGLIPEKFVHLYK